jgi:hypothetical protein
MAAENSPKKPNKYSLVIERIFLNHYSAGITEFKFHRTEVEKVASKFNIKNLGDILYSFRYRTHLPARLRAAAGKGMTWRIVPAGKATYAFLQVPDQTIVPNKNLAETKVPDATPGIISKYALTDEQALLAKVRYNRLIDIFTGVACYSLQSHLRTFVSDMGQTETDEVYVGIDKRGEQYVFPVQAKGGRDRLDSVQILQDFGMCRTKFPSLTCRAIGTQFTKENLIVLFEFEKKGKEVNIVSERHYRLVHPDEISDEELANYRIRSSE